MTLPELTAAWLTEKQIEAEAVERRRQIEDQIVALAKVPLAEGTTKVGELVITQRFTRKVDSALLQEIAAKNGSESQLATLFRWKPEIDSKAFNSAPESITKPLLAAITTTPGRASFSVKGTK